MTAPFAIRPVGKGERAAWEPSARKACTSRVYSLTREDNAAARALYDKLAERSGFIQYRKVF